MFRRLVREESGMTMGLVVIMVVLIGVMGAGLLTFVTTDLSAVVEQNQGQKALEKADAGIRAARMEILAKPDENLYKGGESASTKPWYDSSPNTLDGAAFTGKSLTMESSNDVQVTINYENSSKTYVVTSTGTAGQAKRRVEAILKAGAGGWSGIQNYYTDGDIRIDTNTEINSISFFTSKNVWLNNPSFSWLNYGSTPASTTRINMNTNNTKDVFGDWNRAPNTNPRRTLLGAPIDTTGFGAEGRICRVLPCTSSSGTSVADNVYAYDTLTAKKFVPLSPGSGTGRITYPFDQSKIAPSVDALQIFQEEAARQGKSYDISVAGSSLPAWSSIYASSDSKRVVYVTGSATNPSAPVVMNAISGETQGVLIGKCIDLTMAPGTAFKGIIMLLKDSTCPLKGRYISDGSDLQGYVYAQGDATGFGPTTGPPTLRNVDQGIHIKAGSKISALPAGFQLNSVIANANSPRLVSWRERYQ